MCLSSEQPTEAERKRIEEENNRPLTKEEVVKYLVDFQSYVLTRDDALFLIDRLTMTHKEADEAWEARIVAEIEASKEVVRVDAEFGEGAHYFKAVVPREYFFDSVEEARDLSRPTYDEILASNAQTIMGTFGIGAKALERRKTARRTCNCGAVKGDFRATPYGAGHSPWCDVHESKKP